MSGVTGGRWQADVYAAVAARPNASTADLAARLGRPEAELRPLLDQLRARGLAVESQVVPGGWRAVHPSLTIGQDLATRERDLQDHLAGLAALRHDLRELTQLYSEATPDVDPDAVVPLPDRDAVLMRIDQLVADARVEVASFVSSKPSVRAITESRPLDELLAQRGVAMRTIGLEAFVRDPAMARALRESAAMGVRTRLAPTLPTRMLVVDGREAVVANDAVEPGRGAIHVRNPAVVALLVDLFERYWATATPFGEPVASPHLDSPLTPTELAVLRLLALGHKDEAVARATGQSVRTVRRIVAGTCEKVGAKGRFDLALRAAANGWLGDCRPRP